ncbi:MAG TPA: right-handed parallel beta-helix repeat-containing protein [Candidatus Limnocylindria bacterium]|nr:right-handed parallel beta-helix repeat-containing protein [Candidatus Limnocylindria bacterium]
MRTRPRRWIMLAVIAAAVLGTLPALAQPPRAPERPRVTVDTTYPAAPGRSHALRSGDNLQRALDAAKPGEEIVLAAGAVFTGSFSLPNKSGEGWVVIRTSAMDRLPPPGTRVTPAHAAAMAAIVGVRRQPALHTKAGAHHFRFVGIEIRPQAGGYTNNLISLGTAEEKDPAALPHHFIFDRCYIHGDPKVGGRRGLTLNGGATAVIDSHVSDWKARGEDTQAVGGWSGPGPFKLVNNYLEAAGENVMFGGGDPSLPNLVPSDIEIRRNHFAKPLTWHHRDRKHFAGTRWTVKNLLELKNARRVVIDGNLFERSWQESQGGYVIKLSPRNQDGSAPWSTVEDVTITNNVLRSAKSGIAIHGTDDEKRSQDSKRILIRNNLFYDVGGQQWGDDTSLLFAITDGASDLVIEHNTALHEENISFTEGRPHRGFVFRNNIVRHNEYGIAGGGERPGTAALARYFPGAVVVGNVLIGAKAAEYPGDNFFPPSVDAVGFVDTGRHQYGLAPKSPYRGKATDGTDPGADFEALRAAVGRGMLP